jgi:hypothetical protein
MSSGRAHDGDGDDGSGGGSGSASGAAVVAAVAGAGAGADAVAAPAPAPAPDAGGVSAGDFRVLSERLCAAVRMIVLDFDFTVLNIHSFHEKIEEAAVALRAWADDFVDLELFRGLVADAHAHGIVVAIASFGKYETIQAYMDQVFPAGHPHAFTRATISTPSSVHGKDGYSVESGKNKQIRKLCEQNGVELSRVLFVDGGCRVCRG